MLQMVRASRVFFLLFFLFLKVASRCLEQAKRRPCSPVRAPVFMNPSAAARSTSCGDATERERTCLFSALAPALPTMQLDLRYSGWRFECVTPVAANAVLCQTSDFYCIKSTLSFLFFYLIKVFFGYAIILNISLKIACYYRLIGCIILICIYFLSILSVCI